VIEIDGASNNGVDAIRELRDSVGFMPSEGKYKVYIIDEVHMLSTSAFNALLKTLEEPPAHVVFILATTEVHKIPQTILSRCQRFDFRRISTKAIAQHLKKICAEEGLKVSDEALWLIAREGDGSMRDSQSLLDHVISFSQNEMTVDNVVQILALTDRVMLQEILNALVERQTSVILSLIERMNVVGVEPEVLMEELLEMIRNTLFTFISPDRLSTQLEVPDHEVQFYQSLCDKTNESDLHLLFDMAVKSQQDVLRATDSRLVMEMALLRMASSPQMVDLKKLFSAEKDKEEPAPKSLTPSIKAPSASARTVTTELAPSLLKSMADKVAKENQSSDEMALWLKLVDRARAEDALFAAKIENVRFVKLDRGLVSLQVPPNLQFIQTQFQDAELRKKMQHFVDLIFGPGYSFEILQGKGALRGDSVQTVAQKQKSALDLEVKSQIENHPKVQAAAKIFNGRVGEVMDAPPPKKN
jgi:DNA polymerase-3 subunit gamma/tau